MLKALYFVASLFLAIFIFVGLVEILSPPPKVTEIVEETPAEEPAISDDLYSMADRYNVKYEKAPEPEIVEPPFWETLKSYHIFTESKFGFLVFYFLIFVTLVSQIFYTFTNSRIAFEAVDLNLQAPPMLGVGGTIYALVNANISGSVSIVQELSAILMGAGLTTLLGIFVFIINHYLTRFITTK
ncbi:hypothetical protein ThvES_00018240 [Thiovulum sp. ES]|nr:hypothetical protein ThvES_00018240 [Thiovulum sp. ES]